MVCAGWVGHPLVHTGSVSPGAGPTVFEIAFSRLYSCRGWGFFRAKFFSETYDKCFLAASGDISEAERMLNHVLMYDVFSHCTDQVSESIFLQVCNVIELAWRMVLKEKFPEKTFCVEAENSEQNYGPVITFYQVGR